MNWVHLISLERWRCISFGTDVGGGTAVGNEEVHTPRVLGVFSLFDQFIHKNCVLVAAFWCRRVEDH